MFTQIGKLCVGIAHVHWRDFSYETENAIFCLMQTHKELTEIVDGLSIENAQLIKVSSFYSLLSCLTCC